MIRARQIIDRGQIAGGTDDGLRESLRGAIFYFESGSRQERHQTARSEPPEPIAVALARLVATGYSDLAPQVRAGQVPQLTIVRLEHRIVDGHVGQLAILGDGRRAQDQGPAAYTAETDQYIEGAGVMVENPGAKDDIDHADSSYGFRIADIAEHELYR